MSEKLLILELQIATESHDIPTREQIERWALAAYQSKTPQELCIRIVDEPEMIKLNEKYRHKKGSTNVLSFDYNHAEAADSDEPFLGDIVICVQQVLKEAKEQTKTAEEHFAHMIVHGMLHLQGYEHETEEEANKMEKLEIDIMKTLGYSNPYQD